MKVVNIGVLEEFNESYPDVTTQIDNWLTDVKSAIWHKFAHIKARYSRVDFISPDNLVFDLKGKKYRLWVKINYKYQLIYIVKAGTHKEYDHWKIN